MLMNSGEYLDLVQSIKQEIQSAQYRAALNVNRELICLYYDIGLAINEHKTWGNKFIENLATDIRLAFPEAKGYSVRNLKYMAKFATTYPDREFVQTEKRLKMDGRTVYWFIKLKAIYTKDRLLQTKLIILKRTLLPRKVSLPHRQ